VGKLIFILKVFLAINLYLTSHFGSCPVTYHSFLTVQSYLRQLNILTNLTTALGVNSVLSDKLITDWSIGNMNPDVTP